MTRMTPEEFKRITASLAQISLGAEEKRAMLTRIYETSEQPRPIASPWSISMVFSHRVIAACLVVFVMTSGTAYAAAQSLPGDVLYPLKVKVMEPIAVAVRWDDERRTAYQITLLQERVRELQTLRKQGRIDSDTNHASYAAIEHNLTDMQTNAARTHISTQTDIASYIEAYNALAETAFRLAPRVDVGLETEHGTSTEPAKMEPSETKHSIIIEQAAVVQDMTDTAIESGKKAVEAVTSVTESVREAAPTSAEASGSTDTIVVPIRNLGI